MRTAIRIMKAKLPLLALAFTILIISSYVIAELPSAIQADRLLVQAERQIRDGDFALAIATLDRDLVLQEEHGLEMPAAFWFKHAQASLEAKLTDQAVVSATHYLQEAGRDGEHYMAALELLDAAEQERVEAAVLAGVIEQVNQNMVRIPAGSFSMGCVSGQNCSDDEPVRRVTISRPFALLRHEVTFAQWDACVADGGCTG